MADKLNILAVCGSLRKGSFNRMLMNNSIALAPEGMSIKEAPPFGSMPIYNFDDQQATGFPASVNAWCDAIKAADGVLFVIPEYNWSIPGGLKNAIDWASRLKEQPFNNKVVAVQSAAGGLLGGARAQLAMRQSLTSVDVIWFGRPEVIIAFAAQKFDEQGKLKDQTATDMIKAQLAAFEKFVRKQVGK
jgi:chromate reductase, NAD(P)H dehydrogenase (quinone)